MDRDKENDLAMGRTVAGVLGEDQFASLLAQVIGFATDKTKLEGNISTIEDLAKAQAVPTEGVTDLKLKARLKLTSATLVVAGGLRRIARQSGDSDLLHQASLSRSDLTHGRDEHALTIAGTINNLGATNAAALIAANVDATKLAALNSAFGTFKQLVEAPRQRVVDTKTATDKLVAAFSDFHITLADLDDLADTVRETHPDFYIAYKNARIVIDRPGGLPPKNPPQKPQP